MFKDLARKDPENFAVTEYATFKSLSNENQENMKEVADNIRDNMRLLGWLIAPSIEAIEFRIELK